MNIITFASSKGGVGKSLLVCNLGKILADEGYKVCLLDGNLSFGNLDTILNIEITKTIFDFFKNGVSLKDIVLEINQNFSIIPSYSGEKILDIYDENLNDKFIEELLKFQEFDFLFIDTPANSFLKITQDFIQISDEIIMVTTPQPPAIINTYTSLKILLQDKNNISIISNMSDINEREFLFDSLQKVLKNNISKDFSLKYLGGISRDKKVLECVSERVLLVDEYPTSIIINELKIIASNILTKFEKDPIKVEKITKIKAICKKIFDLI